MLRSWDVSSGSLRWESLAGLDEGGGGGEGAATYPLTAGWKPGAPVSTVVSAAAGEISLSDTIFLLLPIEFHEDNTAVML